MSGQAYRPLAMPKWRKLEVRKEQGALSVFLIFFWNNLH